MAKIKKNDSVVIISGKDKGKSGKVLEVLTKKDLVLVSGINMKKKHQKPNSQSKKGQIIDIYMPVHVSNVALESSGKKTRAGFKIQGDKKIRISRKTGKEI